MEHWCPVAMSTGRCNKLSHSSALDILSVHVMEILVVIKRARRIVDSIYDCAVKWEYFQPSFFFSFLRRRLVLRLN
jgi:hypothetical protein